MRSEALWTLGPAAEHSSVMPPFIMFPIMSPLTPTVPLAYVPLSTDGLRAADLAMMSSMSQHSTVAMGEALQVEDTDSLAALSQAAITQVVSEQLPCFYGSS